jgi:hypothetical protein
MYKCMNSVVILASSLAFQAHLKLQHLRKVIGEKV